MTTNAPNDIEQWVLLRGLSRERRHWGEFLELLQRESPQRQFHCIDLPGTGDQYQQVSPGSVAGIRAHLQRQFAALGLTEPFGIIGLSLGGMLALDWMAASDGVKAVVIINSSCKECPANQRISPRALWLIFLILCCRDPLRREQLVLTMGSRRYSSDRAMVEHWAAIQKDKPVSWHTVGRQLRAAATFRLPPNRYDTPGLVLFSRADQMVSYRCSERIAGFYGWPTRGHASAGHDIALDDPRWVVGEILDWWRVTADDKQGL